MVQFRSIVALLGSLACTGSLASAATEPAVIAEMETTCAALRQALDELEATAAARRATPAAEQQELRALREETERTRTRAAELAQRRRQLEAEIPALLAAYQQARAERIARARAAAAGEVIAPLVLTNGRLFERAVIREVDEVGMVIERDDGRARVPCDQLGPEWWDRFEWSLDLKQQQLAAEQHHDEQLRQQGDAAEQTRRDQQTARLDRERQDRQRNQPAPQPPIAANQPPTSRLSEPPRRVASVRRRYYDPDPYCYYYDYNQFRGCRPDTLRRPLRPGIYQLDPYGNPRPMAQPGSGTTPPQTSKPRPVTPSQPARPNLKAAPTTSP